MIKRISKSSKEPTPQMGKDMVGLDKSQLKTMGWEDIGCSQSLSCSCGATNNVKEIKHRNFGTVFVEEKTCNCVVSYGDYSSWEIKGGNRWKIRDTKKGSSRLGTCGICDKRGDNLFLQVCESHVSIVEDATDLGIDGFCIETWNHVLFSVGHFDCLMKMREG